MNQFIKNTIKFCLKHQVGKLYNKAKKNKNKNQTLEPGRSK